MATVRSGDWDNNNQNDLFAVDLDGNLRQVTAGQTTLGSAARCIRVEQRPKTSVGTHRRAGGGLHSLHPRVVAVWRVDRLRRLTPDEQRLAFGRHARR